MNGRVRCAKLFIYITDLCKMWILTFVEGRINGQTLKNYIAHNKMETQDDIIKHAYNKMVQSGSHRDADISALCRVIKLGNLLRYSEQKNKGSRMLPTIGDQIDKIRLMRNELMHISEASLDENDYNDNLTEIKELATFFEKLNGCVGKYTTEIEEIDNKPLDGQELENTMQRYKTYVDFVIKIEIPKFTPISTPSTPSMPEQQKQGTYTRDIASFYASKFENPVGQAVGGFFGGVTGLVADILTSPFK